MKQWSFGLSAVLMAGLVGGCVGVGVTHIGTAHAAGTTANKAVTVFVDATFGFREDHMASEITESNAKFAARGYHFVDMAPYNENGDLQGFFVTYARD
ncbi:MAG TPA: hypothetical protein VFJ15_05050 [Oleiagrimonas sp.]|nr:hypothetical protein [Oleiagrimonas sp.]